MLKNIVINAPTIRNLRMIRISREANPSTMERVEGIVNMHFLKDFKESLIAITEDLVEDGFEKEDILQIIVTYANKAYNEVV